MATKAISPRPMDALCMSVSVAAFDAWLIGADAGDELVYARGPVIDQKRDVVSMVRDAVKQLEVRTHQRKVDGVWEYYAVRRKPEARLRSVAAPSEPRAETVAGRMLAILRRCAALALPARTNAELARELNLKDGEAARYIFNQLVEGRHITVQNMGVRERRVVTIVATGKSTVRGKL